jgi:hypothetical protein
MQFSHIKHQLFCHEEEVHEYVLHYLYSSTDCPGNSLLHVRKPGPNGKITLTVDQLLHHIQTEQTNYKNLFLQMDYVPSKQELLLSYTAV